MGSWSIVLNLLENNLKIIKKQKINEIYVYNKNRFLKLLVPKDYLVHYNQHTKNLEIWKSVTENLCKILETELNNLLFNFNRLWHVKIKFTGKGFKIKRKKKKKSIKFYFYYSHINVIILKQAKLKQRKKNKFIIKTWNKTNLITTFNMITAIRALNIYTKRGIRTSKQIVLKKTGKKSNY